MLAREQRLMWRPCVYLTVVSRPEPPERVLLLTAIDLSQADTPI